MAGKRTHRDSPSKLGRLHRVKSRRCGLGHYDRLLLLEPLEDRRLLACPGGTSEVHCESFETNGQGSRYNAGVPFNATLPTEAP